MTILLSVLRDELREHLGYGDEIADADADRTTGWKDVNVELLLNRAFWEVIDKFPFREKEETTTFVTVVGDSFMTLPTDFNALRKISIQDLTSLEWTPLERMSVDYHERKADSNTSARGKPERYFRDNVGVRLQEIPDDIYTLRIKYWISLADLTSTKTDPEIPQIWHEIILYGGVWRGFIRLQSFNEAQAMKAHQLSLIDSAVPVEGKEEFDSPMAGVDIPEELTKI